MSQLSILPPPSDTKSPKEFLDFVGNDFYSEDAIAKLIDCTTGNKISIIGGITKIKESKKPMWLLINPQASICNEWFRLDINHGSKPDTIVTNAKNESLLTFSYQEKDGSKRCLPVQLSVRGGNVEKTYIYLTIGPGR